MSSAPIFVKIDKHKEMIDTLEGVKAKLHEAKEALKRISELKVQEDQEIANWHSELSRVEEKLSAIHDSITKEG